MSAEQTATECWLRLLSILALTLGGGCAEPAAKARRGADSGAAPDTQQLPRWAVEAGHDEHGSWAEFELDGHRTRLRSIPKGKFTMGSPQNEPERIPDEPQHEVTLSSDYWLAESEATQTLWRLVMEDNPSQFVSDERPVENIAWPDVQRFLRRLNERVPGLDARLPTEAEWEYGCRAGTTLATYGGALLPVGLYNAPVLDDIAWYGGNSGVGFELDIGFDTSLWEDKQYPDAPAGSHPVRRKQPNRWGVHDCLGNVWEWCQDWFGEYDDTSVTDPPGPKTGDGRVIRGGSWLDRAGDLRVANRNQGTPEDKVAILGFRLARGADSSHGVVDAGRVDTGRVDAGRLDAGEAASDGAITRDEAGRIMRHGFWDPLFPICNSPTCVPLNSPCQEDMDCCQQAEWNDKYLCIGGYCGYLLPGFDPVWHDPIPVCSGDAGAP